MSRATGPVVGVVAVMIASVALAPLAVVPATAAPTGQPNLSVTLADDTVAPGADTRLRFTVSNAGEVTVAGQGQQQVTTARDVKVTVEDGSAPLSVETGTVAIGSVPDGAAVPAAVLVHVDEDAEPGTYRTEVTVEYSYTAVVGDRDTAQIERTVEETFRVELTVDETPRFAVVAAETSARVGEPGTVTLQVRNVGDATATDATLQTSSPDPELSVGAGPGATTALGDVAPGATRTVTTRASVVQSATARSFALDAVVAYEDADGVPAREQLTARVDVGAEQTFSVVDVNVSAPVGGRGSVALTVRNTGRTVTDATLQVRSSSPAFTFGGTPTAEPFVGEWAAGETRTVSVAATVAPDAERRSYAVDVTPAYEVDGQDARGRTLTVGAIPDVEQTFAVVSRTAQVGVGDTGNVTLTVRNTGRTVEDAAISVQSSNAVLSFGGTPSARTFVGEWAAGETRTVSVAATVAPDAERRSYAVDVTVDYTRNGDDGRSTPVTTGIVPDADQTFAVDGAVNLRVGAEGNLTGTVRNDGPGTVRNAVLVLESGSRTIDVVESETAVGTLAPGEAAAFAFELDVSDAAAPGPRQFTLRLRYEDGDGTTRRSEPLYVTGPVDAQQAVFEVSPVNGSFAAGAGGQFAVTVTNTDDQVLTDISAKLFADDPISASDDEAFISRLRPGESRRLTFSLSVAGGAIAKSYPVSIDFQYDEPDGDTKLSDAFRVPVTVTAAEGGGGPLAALPAIDRSVPGVAALAGAGGLLTAPVGPGFAAGLGVIALVVALVAVRLRRR